MPCRSLDYKDLRRARTRAEPPASRLVPRALAQACVCVYAAWVIGDDFRDTAREFARLCGVVEAQPDFHLLRRLAREFARLPYENFSKILSAAENADPVKRLRGPDIVLAEHLEMGAGGTCFSLTHLFRCVLDLFGFEAKPALCDRSYGPDTHCALIVPVGRARFLIDPGYLMQEPIELPGQGVFTRCGPQGDLTLMRLGQSSQLLLVSDQNGARKIRYRLRDAPVPDDIFLARWIDSFDWPMMRRLCASRHTEQGQLYMRDGRLRRVSESRQGQRRLGPDFAEEVERSFGIDRRLVLRAREALAAQLGSARTPGLKMK